MARSSFSGPVRSLNGFYSQGPGSVITLAGAAITLDPDLNAGRLLRITNPNAVITLPPINALPDPDSAGPGPDPNTTNNLGVIFSLIVAVAAVNVLIKTVGLDRFVGSVVTQGAAGALTGFSALAASATITLNGGTTGGIVGSRLSLQAVGANQWLVRDANLTGAGALATPFS